jgi:hypothetical protein
MKTIGVIFVLALITIAGEWYTDRAFTSGQVATTRTDPVLVGVAVAERR